MWRAQVRDAGSLLGVAGLSLPTVDVDDVVVHYSSPLALVRHLRCGTGPRDKEDVWCLCWLLAGACKCLGYSQIGLWTRAWNAQHHVLYLLVF